MKATAVIGYYYPTGDWQCIDIGLGPLAAKAETYERFQTDRLKFTKIIDVEIKKLNLVEGEFKSIELADGFEIPEVETLEQSIEKNRAILSAMIKRH